MNDDLLRVAINMHVRTIVMLLDAAERAGGTPDCIKRLHMARDAAIDFKRDIAPFVEAACRAPTQATSA